MSFLTLWGMARLGKCDALSRRSHTLGSLFQAPGYRLGIPVTVLPDPKRSADTLRAGIAGRQDDV
jgi:hypothetical protein